MSNPDNVTWGRFPAPNQLDHSIDSGGGGGDNGGMDKLAHLERRVDRIDDRLERIEGDMSSIKTTLASLDAKMDIGSIRSSVEKAHTDIYKWAVSIIAVVGAIYFGIQRLGPPPAAPHTQHSPTQNAAPTQAPTQ